MRLLGNDMNKELRRPISALLATLLAASLLAVPGTALAEEAAQPTADAPAADTDGILVIAEGTSSVAALAADGGGETGVEAAEVREALEDAGLQVTEQLSDEAGGAVFAANAPAGMSDEEAARMAGELPGVACAQPNYVYYAIDDISQPDLLSAGLDEGEVAVLAALPLRANDPYAAISSPTASRNQYWLYASAFPEAWEFVTTDGAVTVAVMDSAVYSDHEDLRANVLRDEAWDATDDGPMDFDTANYTVNSGHGTSVAGVVSGVANNGRGIAGASFNGQVLPVRVFNNEGQSSTKFIYQAFMHLMREKASGRLTDLRVVNLSLGTYKAEAVADGILRGCIALMRDDFGVVTICAGGNGDKAGRPRTDPLYPADWPECVAVTALTADGANASWSDYNLYKDISAPGVSMLTTRPGSSNAYGTMSGTSFSAPLVSGAFMLLFTAFPEASVGDARDAVYASATPISDSVNDRSETSGSHGALNAKGALCYLKAWRFTDMPRNHWSCESVGYAALKGIVNGYADGSGAFGVEATVTREQAACMLYNYLGDDASAPAAPQGDVDQGQWYAGGVNWAVATGAMNGYSASDFGVGHRLTREQAACILANASHADVDVADPTKFNGLKDTAQASDWARAALIWVVDEGILNGVDNGDGTRSLAPGQYVTRSQMAALMTNAIEAGIL